MNTIALDPHSPRAPYFSGSLSCNNPCSHGRRYGTVIDHIGFGICVGGLLLLLSVIIAPQAGADTDFTHPAWERLCRDEGGDPERTRVTGEGVRQREGRAIQDLQRDQKELRYTLWGWPSAAEVNERCAEYEHWRHDDRGKGINRESHADPG